MTSTRLFFATMIASMLIAPAILNAQQAVTRVEGFIKDELSGGPVGCKIYVYNEAGEKVRSLRSNSGDGSFLAVVNDAGKHKFVIAGHNVYRSEFFVDVPASTKFQDIKQEFTVTMFSEGHVLYSGVAFGPNSAVLTEKVRTDLKEVHEALDVNQQLNLILTVTVDQDQMARVMSDSVTKYLKDSIDWAKAVEKHEKKYRRRKEKPDPPVAPIRPMNIVDPNVQLLAERAAAVTKHFADVRNADTRITVSPVGLNPELAEERPNEEEILKELTSKKKKNKTKKKTSKDQANPAIEHPTLVVKIGEVKRLFD